MQTRAWTIPALAWFYLATPVFLLLDLALQWDVRVSFFDQHPAWKYGYYLLCFLLGLWMHRQPVLVPVLATVEGGVNMLLLTASILVPYYEAIDAITAGATVENPFNQFNVVNYLISGMIIVISLQLRLASARPG